MPTVTEAEKAYLDSLFRQEGGTASERDNTVMDARFAVLRERLPDDLLGEAVRVYAEYVKAKERYAQMYDRLAKLGFVGDWPGGKLWKWIAEAAKRLIGGDEKLPASKDMFEWFGGRP